MGLLGALGETFQLQVKMSLDNQQFMNQLQATGAKMRNIGRSMTMFLTAPIIGFGILALKTAADFETSMNRVGAVSRATGEEFEALANQARELGRTTQFTASQAADGMNFLAMAGFEVNEIVGAMPATLDLAAAAQIELGRAADIASNILTGFGQDVDELGTSIDVMVQTFTSANTDILQLGEAMKLVGPIAAGLGLEFNEVVGALGLLGNAGIQASLAGTSLRAALAALTDQTPKVRDKLASLGVEVMTTEGNIKSIKEIMIELEQAGANAMDLMVIFGRRAGPAMAALLSQGSDELERMIGLLDESGGRAAEVAKAQMEGLNGALLRLKSAFEGFMIAFSESGLLDAVQEIVEDITKWIQGLAELDKAQLNLIVKIGLFAAALGPLLLGLGNLLTVLPVIGTALAALASGPIGWVVLGLGAIATALGVMNLGIDFTLGKTEELTAEMIEQRERADKTATALEDLRVKLNNLDKPTDDTTENFKELKEKIQDIIDINPDFLWKLGLVQDEEGNLIDVTGRLINSVGDLQAAFDNFTVQNYLDELRSAEGKTPQQIQDEQAPRPITQGQQQFDVTTGQFVTIIPFDQMTDDQRRALAGGGGLNIPGLNQQQEQGQQDFVDQFSKFFTDRGIDLDAVPEEEEEEDARRRGGTDETDGGAQELDEKTQSFLRIIEGLNTGLARLNAQQELALATGKKVEDNRQREIDLTGQALVELAVLNTKFELTNEQLAIKEVLEATLLTLMDEEETARQAVIDSLKDEANEAKKGPADEPGAIDKQELAEKEQEADRRHAFETAEEKEKAQKLAEEAARIAARDAINDYWDSVGEAFIGYARQLGRAVVSGDIGKALESIFNDLGAKIGAGVESLITSSIGGGGLFGSIVGAFGGGVIGAGISMLGGLFNKKSAGDDPEAPSYVYVTNFEDFFRLGATLPASFIFSGRVDQIPVDPHGRTIDFTWNGYQDGEHFDA